MTSDKYLDALSEVGEPLPAPPPPGSNAAIALGCTCPVLDDAHGLGWFGGSGGESCCRYAEGCPVHVAKASDP